ncbi:MAG TPA: hypothetical protein VNZ26_24625, partial [Vicinamibacterales bacterium]|nr:hypothetical protein [Vicinamibacterales bacterium]
MADTSGQEPSVKPEMESAVASAGGSVKNAGGDQNRHPVILHDFHPVARVRKPRPRLPVFGLVASGVTLAFIAGALIVLAILPGYLIGNPQGLSSVDRVRVTNDVRGFLLQAIGGVALLIGLVLTWRTLRLNRETHLTDRFTAAVSQLDAKTITARTGAIFALERIARDSPRDRPMIVATLATYVTERRAID